MKKIVYYFCYNLSKDPVSARIYDTFNKLYTLKETKDTFDGYKVMEYKDGQGNLFSLVRTTDVLSHKYETYLEGMNKLFGDYDYAGLVNWHEGDNAPKKVLCMHSIGDVTTGVFGPTNPVYNRNLVMSMERERKKHGLDDFSVKTEATHWSGVMYGSDPKLIVEYKVPIVDIEIGSCKEDWENENAVEVLTRAIAEIFEEEEDSKEFRNIMYFGGVHFEESMIKFILNGEDKNTFSHVLPNQWLVKGEYDLEENKQKIVNAINSSLIKVDLLVFHDKLKGAYKNLVREIGDKLDIPYCKHKAVKIV